MTKQPRTSEKIGSLNDLFLDVVDETLKQVFREEGIKAIYNYLENNHHLRREDISKKPDVFCAGLESLMASAAQLIQKMILRDLYDKLGLRFREREGHEFSDYVKELREAYGC